MSEKTYAIFDTAANRKIIGELRQSGAPTILFPPLETERTAGATAEIFGDLKRFDWLIFRDVFAVEYFLERQAETDFDLYELDDWRVCAFGEAVSDALRFASLHADVIPARLDAAAIYSALIEYVGASEIEHRRFLILTGEASENDLTKILRNESAEVVELPIYQVKIDESGALVKLKTLLKGGAIDEFILTAPADLVWLKHYFKSEKLHEVFAETAVSVTDGVMFQAAREHDFPRCGFFNAAMLVK